MRWNASPRWALYANAGTSFVAPTPKAVGGTLPAGDLGPPGRNGQLPNPDLAPENGLGGDDSLTAAARPLPALTPPGPTDPLHPRPAEIRELDSLAHGPRHLAFLLSTDADGAVASALGPRAAAALRALQPTVAGELPTADQ